jgi:hypothetical protein
MWVTLPRQNRTRQSDEVNSYRRLVFVEKLPVSLPLELFFRSCQQRLR